MSRNIGHVVFQSDSFVSYFIYNGTSEQCYPKLFPSLQSASCSFMEGVYITDDACCDCGNSEPVIIFPYNEACLDTAYAVHWTGTACRRCGCIHTGLQNPKYI